MGFHWRTSGGVFTRDLDIICYTGGLVGFLNGGCACNKYSRTILVLVSVYCLLSHRWASVDDRICSSCGIIVVRINCSIDVALFHCSMASTRPKSIHLASTLGSPKDTDISVIKASGRGGGTSHTQKVADGAIKAPGRGGGSSHTQKVAGVDYRGISHKTLDG